VGMTLSLFAIALVANASIDITYSDHQSKNEMRTQFLDTAFFPAIERESAGRIKINLIT
jgi:hypothetical protein